MARNESSSREAESQEQAFDLDKAFNNTKFLEFLGKYPDSDTFDTSEANIKEVETRFKAFERTENVSRGMKHLYKEKVSREIGVNLDDKELAGVDTYIESESINNPAEIERMSNELGEYNTLQQEIPQKERELMELGGREELDKIRDALKKVKDTKGFKKNLPLLGKFFRSKGENEARKKLKDEYGMKIGEVEGQMSKIDSFKEAEKRFEELKGKFLVDVAPSTEIINTARDKAQKALREMAKPDKGLKDLEKAQTYYEKLKNTDTVNYLEGIEESKFQSELDTAIDGKVYDEVKNAVEKCNLGPSPLNNMERALQTFLARTEVGSKKQQDAKDFVRKTIRDLEPTLTDKSKKMILKRILVKFT